MLQKGGKKSKLDTNQKSTMEIILSMVLFWLGFGGQGLFFHSFFL